VGFHMRRSDRRITDQTQIDAIIQRGRYVTLALAAEEPYVVTLSYGYDSTAQRLYFHVANEGRKLDLIAMDPRACGTIIIDHGYTQGECEHPFESVLMDGVMRLVTSAEEKLHAIQILVEHLENDAPGYWASRSWQIEDRLKGFTALAFEIDETTAKQGK
jgi:nitroimidazol reductase NimA-like FMN-containing flavoprotein (pyridoxamine 5'-phosphate oxidase superfamily)